MTLMHVIIAFVIIVVTMFVAFSMFIVMFPVQTAADRLEQLTVASEVKGPADITGSRDATLLEQIAARLGQLAAPSDDEGSNAEVEKVRLQLKQAGYRNRRALDIYNGLRVAGAVLLPVVVAPAALFMETQAVLFAMLIAAAVGYYAPMVMLANQAQTRQASLLRSFPDALDLLVSSVESGLGLDQAFKRVAREMVGVAPDLAREFTMVNSEIAAGVERLHALKHLEERTGLDEVKSLVNMLAQAERFGSSVADSLRIYSAVAREKRMSRAEELAGQVGSKLTIIMIVFFLPVLFAILLAPSGIRMFVEKGAE
ncbi:MAG: type II secretion system F family protein [Alphaproteobacteria bacterium]|nr:type II secretion system F family protein [Alphaproteobacteria bacterium]